MKLLAKIIGVIAISVLLGAGCAIMQLKSLKSGSDVMIRNGCWQVNPKMDLKQNDWQRARIAIIGLFALRESEVLYFVASEDSDGNKLTSTYEYELTGTAPNARYWSYTIYGKDYYLIPNESKTYSFNLDDLSYVARDTLNPELPIDVPKSYNISISTNAKEGNWLPSGSEDQFHILLRMYNPAPEVYNNLESVSLPVIRKIEK